MTPDLSFFVLLSCPYVSWLAALQLHEPFGFLVTWHSHERVVRKVAIHLPPQPSFSVLWRLLVWIPEVTLHHWISHELHSDHELIRTQSFGETPWHRRCSVTCGHFLLPQCVWGVYPSLIGNFFDRLWTPISPHFSAHRDQDVHSHTIFAIVSSTSGMTSYLRSFVAAIIWN